MTNFNHITKMYLVTNLLVRPSTKFLHVSCQNIWVFYFNFSQTYVYISHSSDFKLTFVNR